MLKYNPNELQMILFNREMNKMAKETAMLEHEKYRYSLIRKANDEVLQRVYNTRSSAAKILNSDQLVEMQNDINAQKQNLQELYYQNSRNELLAKGQQKTLELTHTVVANDALKNHTINQINSLTNQIQHLTNQLQELQQQNTQIMGESNETRIAALQTQGNLEIQITQLQLEKQNLENLINQMRVGQ
jgi:phage host-nuclease inhibitor protein Gam